MIRLRKESEISLVIPIFSVEIPMTATVPPEIIYPFFLAGEQEGISAKESSAFSATAETASLFFCISS